MAHILFAMSANLYPRTPQQVLEAVLGGLGHTTAFTADGAQALSCLKEKRPDVLVADLALPHCGGMDLARELESGGSVDHAGMILLGIVTAEIGFSYRLLNTEFLRYVDDIIVRPYPDGVPHQNHAFAEQLIVSIGLLLHRLGKAAGEPNSGNVVGDRPAAALEAPRG